MGVSLVHDLESETGSVKYVGPSGDDVVLVIDDGLVEVESIKVESHSRHAQSGEPNTDNRPSSQKEM